MLDDTLEDLLDLRRSCAFAFQALRHERASGHEELCGRLGEWLRVDAAVTRVGIRRDVTRRVRGPRGFTSVIVAKRPCANRDHLKGPDSRGES